MSKNTLKKHKTPSLLKIVAIFYSILFVLVGLWAWLDCWINFNSPKEHLFPGIVLLMIGMPLSMITDKFTSWFPATLNHSLVIMVLITLPALFQCGVFWWLESFFMKKRLSYSKQHLTRDKNETWNL